MSNWTAGELDAIVASGELQIAALGPEGPLRQAAGGTSPHGQPLQIALPD